MSNNFYGKVSDNYQEGGFYVHKKTKVGTLRTFIGGMVILQRAFTEALIDGTFYAPVTREIIVFLGVGWKIQDSSM